MLRVVRIFHRSRWSSYSVAFAIGAAAILSKLFAIGVWTAVVGIEGGARTPVRELPIPLLLWALITAYAWSSRGLSVSSLASAILLAAGIDVTIGLAMLWVEPDTGGLNRAQVAYVWVVG